LPGTNTPAYYENPQITSVKSFIVQAPGVNQIKLFWHKFTDTFCKLGRFINVNIFCFKL
jgi:hypothetical protein